MPVDVKLSAVLSSENSNYDLFLLLWKIFRFKDGKVFRDKPVIREFGSEIKFKLKKGEYAVTYQLGAVVGEHLINIENDLPFEQSFDLNAGVIKPVVIPKENAKPLEYGLVLCRPKVRKPSPKWITVSHPIALKSGHDLVLPADTEYTLEGQNNEADPETHSDEILVKVKPGEIQSLTLVSDKVGYR